MGKFFGFYKECIGLFVKVTLGEVFIALTLLAVIGAVAGVGLVIVAILKFVVGG